MNSKNMEHAITNVDDNYIMEALSFEKKRNTKKNTKRNKKSMIKTIGSIAACAVLVSGISFSATLVALAAGNEQAFDVVYTVFPEIAMQLVPVNESCENNGIRMCVEGMSINGDSADIYVFLQDLTGDRIDGTTDLFDSYEFKTSGDQMAGCSLVSYDEATRKATFLIHVETMNGEIIHKDKITFSLKKFLSGKQELTRELTELQKFEVVNETQKISTLNMRGMSGSDDATFSVESIEDILYPNEEQSFVLTDGVKITAYGFVDGKLHIQAYYNDIINLDNHGWITLNREGKTIQPVSIDFWDKDQIGSYQEYVFDIEKEDINTCKVYGDFVTCNSLTTGDWSVTFSLTDK